MSITATSLSAAVTSTQTRFNVASTTYITAPNFQTGSGITLIQMDQEIALVVGVPVAGTVDVLRGQYGTQAAAHVSGSLVQVGGPTDFTTQQQIIGKQTSSLLTVAATKQPSIFLTGTADVIDPSVPAFYTIKTASADAMTLAQPAVADEGNIITIVSGTDYAHTLTAASTYLCVGASAKKTVATWPAYMGPSITLRVCNQLYHVLSDGPHGTNAGVIVYT